MGTVVDCCPVWVYPEFEDRRRPIDDPRMAGGRAISMASIHVPDTFASNVRTEFPDRCAMTHEIRTRPLLAAPRSARERRSDTKRTSFGPPAVLRNQVTLLKTFADQVVIAIEDVRLFQELRGAGTRDGDKSRCWRYRQLADGYSAGAGCCVENAARLCEAIYG